MITRHPVTDRASWLAEPGFYSLTAEQYHADPCPSPSLSASVALPLLHRSPRHAWWQHPRLNAAFEERTKRKDMDLGTVVHKLILGKGRDVAVIEADSYRTKDAQQQRDAAYAAGQTPILTGDYEAAEEMADAARRRLNLELPGWQNGDSEQVIVWREGSDWCRGMLDMIAPDRRQVLDVKTTSHSAAPETASRTLFNMAYHFKAAFYERGLDALDPGGIGRRKFFFFFLENEPPFEAALLEPDEAAMTIARKQVCSALEKWQECTATDKWPGYPTGVHRVSMPPWMESRWLEREMAEGVADQPETQWKGWTP